MKPLIMCVMAAGLLGSCADRPLVYTGSGVSVLHIQGVKEQIPEKLKVGYERIEFANLPGGHSQTVKSGFDAEYRHFSGVAISDLLLTGAAAAGTGPAGNSTPVSTGCQIVSTNTRFNLGLEVAGSDGVAPSFNAGFKRSILALFPKSKHELPATYTDLSVHTSDFPGNRKFDPLGVDPSRHMTTNEGARIVQTVASGTAASILGSKNHAGISKRLGAFVAVPKAEESP